MKKFFIMALAVLMLITALTGCSSDTNDDDPSDQDGTGEAAFEGTVDEILDQLIDKTIEKKVLDDEQLKNITCYHKNVDTDSCTDILGLTGAEFTADVETAVESKPEGSWFTHSVVVIKAKDGVDIAALAEKIAQGTNPKRFGCLKADAVIVGYAGRYIVLCATFTDTADAIYNTFSELSAIPANRIDRESEGGGLLG